MKRPRTCAVTAARIASRLAGESPPAAISRIEAEPMLEVMITTTFLKLTTRPCASVTRPSSRTCGRVLRALRASGVV